MYPIQDVRIASCKCQSSSSFIFNIEIRQPKEYLLISAISNSDTRRKKRKDNSTYPLVGRPNHKEAFQCALWKAPEASGARSFNQRAFLTLKTSDSFYVRWYFTLLLHRSRVWLSLIAQSNWNKYLQITLPILITTKLKRTRDCTSRTVWHVVWFEAVASKTNQISQKNLILRIF